MDRVKFNLERRKDTQGMPITKNVPIRLSLFFNGNRLEYYTKVRVSKIDNFIEGYYNKRTKNPIAANEPEAHRKNKRLDELKVEAERLLDNAIALEQSPTPEYIRAKLDEKFKGKSLGPEQKLVKGAFEEYKMHVKKGSAESTYKTVKTTEIHFSAYVGKKYSKLTFDEITGRFADGFKDYLISLGHLNNTVVKYSNKFNGFISWCKHKDRKYYAGDARIEGIENDIDVIFLDKKELDQLMQKPMPSASLERVRDIFVWTCNTGMRFGDVFKLKKTDIKDKHITFFIQKKKATVPHRVKLSDQAISILNKYKDLPGDKALPVLSNQKMNVYIKDVMKYSGIDEVITIAEMQGNGNIVEKQFPKWQLIGFHTTRKSFITLAVSMRIPEIEIKAITGHSKNSKAFAKYYTVPEEVKDDAIDNMFSKTGKLRKVM